MSERRPQTESELVELVRGIDARAPEHVHERVQALVAERTRGSTEGAAAPRSRRRRPAIRVRPLPAALGAVAAAAVAVAVVLAVGGSGGHGGSAGPDLRAASALTLAPATGRAPAESSSDRAHVKAAVDGVAFPYWEERLGWRTVGARKDRIAGRQVSTVYYANAHGQRIGYAIVGGTPPAAVGGGSVWRHHGTDYRLLRAGGAEAVVWLRGGRLCVISGRGVDGATLLRLASWDDERARAA